jgi:hypothetical protein
VAPGQHHGADGGHQQEKRGGLEADQEAFQQELADRRGRAEAEVDRRAAGVDPESEIRWTIRARTL